ncbi:MAG TPA: cysteine desulfurase family protein [Longimicrobiaceae bacterium]|nr:cysteine desulfurase family protein [Longimicrobiaceae bacterium]
MKPIYMDYAATTPVRSEVRDAMLPMLEERFGNPSSTHRWGREARAILEHARARLAAVLGVSPIEIIFTRGGTEADNLALLGRARTSPDAPVVCSAIEHKAILATARAAEAGGTELHVLPVDRSGTVDHSTLPDILRREPSVVSVMWANNEVGAIQPVLEIATQCADAGVAFHTDAVQALGKIRIRLDELPVSLLSISAHKIGGPKGVGALFIRRGTEISPMIFGGGHERGLRAGTEDVAGAVGFATAIELAEREREQTVVRLGALRDRLEAALRERVPDLVVNAESAERLPTILNVTVPGADSEALLLTLDLQGIAVSSGSACSSGAVEPSHVLTSMGISPDMAGPSLRFSLGHETTDDEISHVISVFPQIVERLREMSAR